MMVQRFFRIFPEKTAVTTTLMISYYYDVDKSALKVLLAFKYCFSLFLKK